MLKITISKTDLDYLSSIQKKIYENYPRPILDEDIDDISYTTIGVVGKYIVTAFKGRNYKRDEESRTLLGFSLHLRSTLARSPSQPTPLTIRPNTSNSCLIQHFTFPVFKKIQLVVALSIYSNVHVLAISRGRLIALIPVHGLIDQYFNSCIFHKDECIVAGYGCLFSFKLLL